MDKSESLFRDLAKLIPDAKESIMFGAVCIKAPNGKAAAMVWKGDLVVKLEGKEEASALTIRGADYFMPMEGRKMGGWIQIPAAESSQWKKYMLKAMDLVRKLEKNPSKKPAKKK